MSPHSWNDHHMVRSAKVLIKASYVTLGVFLFLFVSLHVAGALYVSSLETKSEQYFQSGITKDISHLKTQGDMVAQNDLLKQALIDEDSDSLSAIIQKELSERDIGLIGVANAQGVIVSRTFSKSNLGQNVFLTAPAGRALTQEKSVESIELTGFGNQIFMTTARLVADKDKMIGVLFANYLMNDEYATRFRDSYLPKGAEVLFYTKEFGVYGASFSDPERRKLVHSYFDQGSGWAQNKSSGNTITFDGNSFYIVKNIIFPGLEQSPGGALIFLPRQDISKIVQILLSLVTSIIFIFFALKYHRHSYGEAHGWRYSIFLTAISFLIFALVSSLLYIQNSGYLKLERIPFALYNSTLRFQPDSGIYDINSEQKFKVMVDVGDEKINAVQAEIVFDPESVDVRAIEIDNSVCSYVIENQIDSLLGRARLSCVLLESKGDRDSLRIADVVVVPKKTGAFTLSFDMRETKVLASDGLGTDVLRMAQSGNYQIDVPDVFAVFSPSHPNQSRWYNNSTAHFVWEGKQDAVYRYEFDSLPHTAPSDHHTIQGTSVTIPIPGDGIFYFHLQDVSGGPIIDYSIRSDRTPPSIIDMQSSSENIVAGDVVRFSFDAQDIGSGIQRNYYIDLGNHLFLPVGSNPFIPFLEVGDRKLILRVYDNANNYSERSQVIHVNSK